MLSNQTKRYYKPLVLLFIVAVLSCIGLVNIRYIATPRLVIKFDGEPASNVTLIMPVSGDGLYRLDEQGSITARELGWNESCILVPRPDGGGVTVCFPKHGTKEVDFQGRVTITRIVKYFGLVSEQFEEFSLTDADIADIESGRKVLADIREGIRRSEIRE